MVIEFFLVLLQFPIRLPRFHPRSDQHVMHMDCPAGMVGNYGEPFTAF
jgi:hypothetical protein